jgi:hypothetical protein
MRRAAEVADEGVRGILMARRESTRIHRGLKCDGPNQPDFRREEEPLTECRIMKECGGKNILIAMDAA